MTKEQFLKTRYIQIATYPNNTDKIGQIFEVESPIQPERFPNIFRELEWWENRTIEEMLTIKYVKLVSYVGYGYEIGAILAVHSYDLYDLNLVNPKLCFRGFYLSSGMNHNHACNCVEPSTEEEFNAYQTNSI